MVCVDSLSGQRNGGDGKLVWRTGRRAAGFSLGDYRVRLAAFPGRIALGLDARAGMLAVSGWAETTSVRATDLARRADGLPLHAIIYTDIQRDGMLEGPNLAELAAMAAATRIPVIASGGISSTEDLRALRKLEAAGVRGAIIGKALYDGRLTLEAGLAAGRS